MRNFIFSGLFVLLSGCGGGDSETSKNGSLTNQDLVTPLVELAKVENNHSNVRADLSKSAGIFIPDQGMPQGLWMAKRPMTFRLATVVNLNPALIVTEDGAVFDAGSEYYTAPPAPLALGCTVFLLPAVSLGDAKVAGGCENISSLSMASTAPNEITASFTYKDRNFTTVLVRTKTSPLTETTYPSRTLDLSGFKLDPSLKVLKEELVERFADGDTKRLMVSGGVSSTIYGVQAEKKDESDDLNSYFASGIPYQFEPGVAFAIHRQYMPGLGNVPTLRVFREDLIEKYGPPSLDEQNFLGWSFDVDGSQLEGIAAQQCLKPDGEHPAPLLSKAYAFSTNSILPARAGCGVQLMVTVRQSSTVQNSVVLGWATFDLWDANMMVNAVYAGKARVLSEGIVGSVSSAKQTEEFLRMQRESQKNKENSTRSRL